MVCGTNSNGANCPQVVISPPNDAAVQLCSSDNSFISSSTGTNATLPFVGAPAMNRGNANGKGASGGMYCYTPNWRGAGFGQSGSYGNFSSLFQAVTDVNINQLWQYGLQASAFLYSDTAFAALPNATTLEKGQIVTPPAAWSQASATYKRYGIQVVTQAGTTGSPNGGQTSCTTGTPSNYFATCTGPSESISAVSCSAGTCTITTAAFTTPPPTGQNMIITGTAESCLNSSNNSTWAVLAGSTTTSFQVYDPICGTITNASDTGTALTSSTTDLSVGQYINFGSQTSTQILNINSSNPAAVVVGTAGSMGSVSSPATLNYAPPVLGLEMQLPTKTAAAPASLAWSQGDVEQASGAASGSPCLFVNVAAGTPGTWASIPCPAFGFVTLSSGTVTVSNAAACTPAATCVYSLQNCNTNSSTALGTLTIGTISVGTSFVINSESATNTLVTNDNSKVCWRIN
jgi:hypothetical protein